MDRILESAISREFERHLTESVDPIKILGIANPAPKKFLFGFGFRYHRSILLPPLGFPHDIYGVVLSL
jgi:hypothetical protein